MSIRSSFLLAALACVGCSDYVKIGVVASSTLIACDYGSTMWSSDGGRWDRPGPPGTRLAEMNPLLGHSPSPSLLTAAAIADIGWGLIVYRSHVPTWLKVAYYTTVSIVETDMVVHNAHYAGACGTGPGSITSATAR